MKTDTTTHMIEQRLLDLQGCKVLVDRDVAEVYQVSTKEVNQAVRNNPKKFPKGYVIQLTQEEWNDLRSKFLTTNFSKTRVAPKAFTEKGLYMLATILKGKQATETTLNIIETFAKLKALQTTVHQLAQKSEEESQKNNQLLKKGGKLMADLLDIGEQETASETTVEINFAIIKLKHITKRKGNK